MKIVIVLSIVLILRAKVSFCLNQITIFEHCFIVSTIWISFMVEVKLKKIFDFSH